MTATAAELSTADAETPTRSSVGTPQDGQKRMSPAKAAPQDWQELIVPLRWIEFGRIGGNDGNLLPAGRISKPTVGKLCINR